jgi:hypothetical protein
MTAWTLEDLRRLDLKYAEEDIHVHQRPFRAAMELLGSNFVIGVSGPPEINQIMDAYAAMMPEVSTSWPGAGIGFAASVDQVRKLTFPVVFGQVSLQPWQVAGFSSAEEWWKWCRQDRTIAGEVALAIADLHDLTNGLNEVEQGNPAAVTLWRMARSNLEDVANTLPTTFSHDSVIQPICMVAELSMKAALVRDGVDPDSFRKGKDGHNLPTLSRRMADARAHRDDPRVQAVRRRPAALCRKPIQAGRIEAAAGRQARFGSAIHRRIKPAAHRQR